MQTPYVVVRLECRKRTYRKCSVGYKVFTKSLGDLWVWALNRASRNDFQNTAELTHQGCHYLEATTRATDVRNPQLRVCSWYQKGTLSLDTQEAGQWPLTGAPDLTSLLRSSPMTTYS